MAEDLDDGEFWLPSEFLTDDDILMEKKYININKGRNNIETDGRFCFPTEFPCGFPSYGPSNLSSPVESVVGSTETESDEEDYLASLTLQMARSMLQEVEKTSAPVFAAENPKAWVKVGSPQSTLCEVGSWSGCSAGSSRGSPNGPSQISSPPTTPMNGKDDAWDLLYAAAGQVVRMKMNDEGPKYNYGRGLLGPPRNPSPVSVPMKPSNGGFYANPPLTQQQIQVNQFNQLKQQQQQQQQRNSAVWGRQVKLAPPVHQNQQQLQNGVRTGGFGNGRCGGRPLGLPSSAWPPLQQPQQASSGMRAVFLGGSGARRESSGTGVFLPRRAGNPTESRKKPVCSTVLLPARVVQALNLNLDDTGSAQPRFGGGFGPEHGNPMLSQQKRNFRPQPSMNHEVVRLPQEWTY